MSFDTAIFRKCRRTWITALTFGLLLTPRQLMSQEAESTGQRPVVAVFQISTDGLKLDRAALGRLTRYLKSRLVINKKFQTLPESSLAEAMANLKIRSYDDCKDESCQIELGKEASAQMSLAVEIWKIEGNCEIIGNLIDLRTATTLGSATVSNMKCSERALMAGLERVSDQLSGKASAESIASPSIPPAVAEANQPQSRVTLPPVSTASYPVSRESGRGGQSPHESSPDTSRPGNKPWAVICGSIPQEGATSRQQAEKIASRLRSSGIDASVHDGRKFPGFRCCFWSVIAGFFASKSEASELVSDIRSKGFDVYTKKTF